eukprot:sb/3462289/
MPGRVVNQRVYVAGDESSSDEDGDWYGGGGGNHSNHGNHDVGNHGNHTAAAVEEEELEEVDYGELRKETIVSQDLLNAIKRGNFELVKETLETDSERFPVDYQFGSGWTPLMYAVEYCYPEMCQYLIGKGADVNTHCDMFYPIMAGVHKDSLPPESVLKCVQLLVDAGASAVVHDRQHITPLMLAAGHGYTETVNLLCSLSDSSYINKQDQRGWTAMLYAAERNHIPCVEALRSHNASIFIQSNEGLSAADIARQCGHQRLFTLLDGKSGTFEAPIGGTFQQHGDLEMFLSSIELSSLSPIFRAHKIDFETLLTMNQHDLESAGVTQIGNQKKLLEAVRQLHPTEFEMPDMSQTLYNLQLDCRDTAKVLKIFNRHLRYMRGSAKYVLGQVRESRKMESEWAGNRVEESGVLDNYMSVLDTVRELERCVQEVGEEMCDKMQPPPANLEDAVRAADQPSTSAASALGFVGLGGIITLGLVFTFNSVLQSPVCLLLATERGWTAMLYAAERNHIPCVEALRSHNASIFIQSNEGLSAGDIARQCGHQRLFTLLDGKSGTFEAPIGGTFQQHGDLEMFLSSIELSSLSPIFRAHKIDFETLLTMNQHDLESAGVTQIGNQKKLLEAVRQLHPTEFEMPDMSQTLYNLQLDCRDTAKVLKIFNRHLRYMRGSAKYVLGQVRESRKMESEWAGNRVEESGVLDNYMSVLDTVRELERCVQEVGEEMCDKMQPPPANLEDAVRAADQPSTSAASALGFVGLGGIITLGLVFTFSGIRQHLS